MRTIGLGLLLVQVGCGAPSRSAPPTPPPPSASVAPPATSPPEGIVVRPETDGLRVSYRARKPALAFRFDDDAAEIRRDTWKVLDAGVSFVDEGVVAPTPVSSFSLAIAPDSRKHDRVYPALTRVGDGWLIYAPHLRLQDGSVRARLTIETPPGWTVMGRRDASGDLTGDGYVFAGPSAYAHRGVTDVISAPSVPAWLLREIELSADGAAAFYERRLGLPLGRRATIVVTYDPSMKGSFHGDTTAGAMMSLRFHGDRWADRDPSAAEVAADFVHHELFHFWNGELARSSQGEARPWLHEGGANYAALLASRERGTMSEDQIRAAINRHLQRCQSALGNRDLRTNGPKRGEATYACGTVLQWAIDLGLRKVSNGQRDVLSWWKDILSRATGEGGTYSLESAYALLEPEASRVADVLLDAGDEKRWTTFAEVARRQGVTMVQRRHASGDLASGLDHVLAIHCGGSRGFFTFSDHVKLDTGTRCGPLSGDLEVDAVAGINPARAPSAMYDKLRQLCAAGKAVDFAWKGKLVARAPCTTPLAKPTLAWQIQKDAPNAPPRR